MKQCDICYYNTEESLLHKLECCKNNSICCLCVDLLSKPICPFCRAHIHVNTPRSLDENMLRHHLHPNSIFDYRINPFDDSFLDSRILRRTMKRLRKLQEREQHNQQNKLLNRALARSIKRQKETDRDIQENIDDGMFVFVMDANT